MEMTESARNATAQEQDVRRCHWWTNSRVHVISFGFVFLNTILIASVLGVLTHHQRVMSSPSGEGTDGVMTLRDGFPGFFFSIEEKTELVEIYRTVNGSALLPVTNSSCVNEDKTICAGESTDFILLTGSVLNACCQSVEFQTDFPKRKKDVTGQWRRIATYKNEMGTVIKQFYEGVQCSQTSKCPYNCKCQTLKGSVSAVYSYNDTKGTHHQVGQFLVENCCVCLN